MIKAGTILEWNETKIFYHVVMNRSSFKIVESIFKNPKHVKYSINSYSIKKHAEQNINDHNSRYFRVIKKRWLIK